MPISHLSLTHLDIRVTDNGLDEPEEGADQPGFNPIVPGDRAPQARASDTSAASQFEARLSLGERTLDAFDVDAFIWNFLHRIRTLEDTFVSIQRPRRCGGGDRGARVKSPGLRLGSGFSDQGAEEIQGRCMMAECANLKESDGAWWGEIAERNVKVNRA